MDGTDVEDAEEKDHEVDGQDDAGCLKAFGAVRNEA